MSSGPKTYDISHSPLSADPTDGKGRAGRRRPELVRRDAGRWSFGLQLVGVVLLAVFTFQNMRDDVAFPAPGGEEATIRHTMLLIASCLEYHRDKNGDLPRSLEEVQLDEEGIHYETDGDSFTLTAAAENRLIEYRDGENISVWLEDVTLTEAGIE